MEDVAILKAAGYICIRITPTIWRARGPMSSMLIYPFQRLWAVYGKPEPYTDVLAVVRAKLAPYETDPPELLEAQRVWREAMQAFIARYPQMTLYNVHAVN